MATITVPHVERLQKLPPDKLLVVYDFVSYLEEHASKKEPRAEAYHTMLASEAILRRDWDQPEEDLAWAENFM